MAFRNLISSLTGKKGRKKTSARKLDRRRVLAAPENLEARKMLTTTGVVTDQDFYASSSEFSGGLNTTVRQSFIVEVDGALDSVEVGIFRTGGSFPITFEVFESNLNADVLGPALGTQVVMSNDLVTFGSGNLSTVDFSGQGIDVELGDRLVILATKPSGAPTSPNIRGRLGNEYMEGRMRPGPASWDLFFRTNILTTFNEAPELDLGTTDPSEYVAGGAPAEVLDTLSIADNDDAELLQATISVSANYLSSEDVLSVDTLSLPAGITSSGFDSVTGTLTLTGAATLADYQDALRTVAYTNTSSTPDLTTRSITVTVEDANSSSSINGTLTDSATRDVEISDVTPGVTVENGVLQVIGTEDADRVKVFKFWNRYYVFTNIDGAKFTKVPASDVDEIYVDTRGGNDRIKVGAFTSTPATLIGGEGDDRIRGGAGDDTIFGGDGQDWIDAGWGNDIVYGGAGDDYIHGRFGNDILLGQEGDDKVIGGFGADIMIGGDGSDKLFGSFGSDFIITGDTNWDDDQAALESMQAAWDGPGSAAVRAQAILDAGLVVTHDDDVDHVFGGPGADWVLYDDLLDQVC